MWDASIAFSFIKFLITCIKYSFNHSPLWIPFVMQYFELFFLFYCVITIFYLSYCKVCFSLINPRRIMRLYYFKRVDLSKKKESSTLKIDLRLSPQVTLSRYNLIYLPLLCYLYRSLSFACHSPFHSSILHRHWVFG